MSHVVLTVVTPNLLIPRLLKSGFKPGGAANGYTSTLMRRYALLTNAYADAKVLPHGCIWGIEEIREESSLK